MVCPSIRRSTSLPYTDANPCTALEIDIFTLVTGYIIVATVIKWSRIKWSRLWTIRKDLLDSYYSHLTEPPQVQANQ